MVAPRYNLDDAAKIKSLLLRGVSIDGLASAYGGEVLSAEALETAIGRFRQENVWHDEELKSIVEASLPGVSL